MANEDKATRYHRLRRRARVYSGACGALLLAGLVVSGAAAALRTAAVDLVSAPVLAVLLFATAVALLLELVDLPFAFYLGVTLERRYGLSRETAAAWWASWAKGTAIAVGLFAGAGIVVWHLLRWTPDRWWIWTSVVLACVMVVLVQLAPVVLLPLFHPCAPLDRPSLTARLLGLAERAGAPVLGVFEWKLGERARKANAALAGLGRTRRILLSDTLLAEHSDDEIEVILAHELSHHVHADLWSGMALQAAGVAAACRAGDVVLTAAVGRFGILEKSDPAGLPLLLLAGGAVLLAWGPFGHALSRAHERRADAYALALTRNAPAFVSAMKRLAAQNLVEEEPSRLVQALWLTHPSTAERIERALAWETARQRPTEG